MFSNGSVKRLIQYRKTNGSIEPTVENAWCEKAVRSLVKKLSSSKINLLENILVNKNPASTCICIPK